MCQLEKKINNEEQEATSAESCSSSSSRITSSSTPDSGCMFSNTGVIRLREDQEEHVLLKHRFYTSIGSLSQQCSVVAIHRNMHSSPSGRACLEAFKLFLKATELKRNGSANVVNGWFGSSEDGIYRILNDGFGISGMHEIGGLHSFGLCIFSERSTMDSMLSSPVDGNGVRHVLFCRVILGSAEEVSSGSRQFCPSSEKFDSGVDSWQSPGKYIIWYPHVNTHILPLYVVSIKMDFHTIGVQREPPRRPSSPWIPFTALIEILSKSLPPSAMCLVRRFHSDYMDRKVTRQQLILRVRQISGDKLLISAIKSFRDKQMKGAICSTLKNCRGK